MSWVRIRSESTRALGQPSEIHPTFLVSLLILEILIPGVGLVAKEKKKLYSYIRWSSEKQKRGSSLERQQKYASDLANEHDLDLVEMIDDGLSAFKGEHIKKGELGSFLEAVKEGLVPEGSWLVVENLDRLSRENPVEALHQFTSILKLGITVVTGMDGQIYKQAEDIYAIFQSVMLFSRAYEESQTKSKRTNGAALAAIQRHVDGHRSEDDYAFAVKAVGSHTWWSDASDGVVRPHQEYFKIAQEIVTLYQSGWGSFRIVGYLNDNYPPPRGPKNKVNKDRWSTTLVTRFANTKALLGEKTITLSGVTYTLKDYYPALISEDDFYRLRVIREANKSTRRSEKTVGLIAGIQVAKCGHCGSALVVFTNTSKRKEGPDSVSLRYICLGGQTKTTSCHARTFDACLIEDTLIRLCMGKLWREPTKEVVIDPAEPLRQKLADNLEKLENLVNSIASGEAVPKITNQLMLSIEAENEGLLAQIEEISEQVATEKIPLRSDVAEAWSEIKPEVLDRNNIAAREKVRELVKGSIGQVRVFATGKNCNYRIEFDFLDGDSLEVVRSKKELFIDADNVFVPTPEMDEQDVEIMEFLKDWNPHVLKNIRTRTHILKGEGITGFKPSAFQVKELE